MKYFNKRRIVGTCMTMTALGCMVLQTSCQLPPGQVMHSIHQEGLIGYLSKSHEERRLLAQERAMRHADDTQPLTSLAESHRDVDQHVGRVPVASTVPGSPDYVYSPHAPGRKLVDVSGFRPGSEALCPYTRKAFRIPANLRQYVGEVPVVEQSPYPSSSRIVGPSRSILTLPTLPSTSTIPNTPTSNGEGSEVTIRTDEQVPYGTRLPGKQNLVYSPHASKTQVVNVEGMTPGSKVRCPYTGKLFRIPLESVVASEDPASGANASGGNLAAPKPETKKAPSKPEVKKEDPAPKVETKKEKLEKAPVTESSGNASTAPKPSKTPSASWAQGKPGYVVSPYGNFLVDVRGKPAGSIERCPFSGKLFRVPAK